MGTNHRRVAGTGAARVQGLEVPDWLRAEAAEANKAIPAGAVTAEQYAGIIKRGRSRASQILRKRVRDGIYESQSDGRREWYWPKKAVK